MIMLIGLGNPGDEYERTRHNIGREIAHECAVKNGFAEFRIEKKWNALVSESRIGKEKVSIVLPETFMNKSGNAAGPAIRFYKLKPKDVFLIHDDADIPLGKAKLSFGKNSAGHKGVESVMRALKTRDFWRFRIGIGGKRDIPAEKLVLKKFTPEEIKSVKKIFKRTLEAVKTAAEKGPEAAMNFFNSG